jgi:hypothetical protein
VKALELQWLGWLRRRTSRPRNGVLGYVPGYDGPAISGAIAGTMAAGSPHGRAYGARWRPWRVSGPIAAPSRGEAYGRPAQPDLHGIPVHAGRLAAGDTLRASARLPSGMLRARGRMGDMQALSQVTVWLDLLNQWGGVKDGGPPLFNVLDHWQALVAGLVALLAALVAVLGAEWFAHRKERREAAAIRAAVAVEVQQFIDTLLRVREMIRTGSSEPNFTRLDLLRFTQFHWPVVYPAMADRIGLLGPSLAKAVVGFYADVERVRYTAKLEATDLQDQISFIVKLIEDTCRGSLPLVDTLGADKAAEIRATIEGMTKSDVDQGHGS